ncbi:hypothetical protein JCM9533A_12320 [Catenuloplanes niger JCM 9533]
MRRPLQIHQHPADEVADPACGSELMTEGGWQIRFATRDEQSEPVRVDLAT